MPTDADVQPVLSSAVAQQGVADLAGGIAYSGVSDAESAGEIAFQGPTADFILYGVVNGAFAQGPTADPTGNIEPVNNPLPYWTGPVNVSGGAVTAAMATVSTYPSGQGLRFTFNPGAAGDEVYFEQIVPVGGGNRRRFGDFCRIAYVSVSNTSNNFGVKLALQYLTIAGATTGTGNSSTLTLTSSGVNSWTPSSIQPPTDAAYLRIRIGVLRNTAAITDSAVIDIVDVRREIARGLVAVAEQSDPDTYNFGVLQQINGRMSMVPHQSSGTVSFSVSNPAAYARITGGHYQVAEQAAPSTPDSGFYAIYAKTDGILYGKNDGGTETALGGGGSGDVATDAIWDAKGDLAAGTGANTASKLTVGANDTILVADSTQSTGVKWTATYKATGALIFANVLNPTITGTVNNWAPAGITACNVIIVDMNGAAKTITGIDASGFTEGQIFVITGTNNGGGALTLAHASGSSTAGNRFGCPGAVNYVLPFSQQVEVLYFPTKDANNCFRVLGPVI